MRLRTMTSHKSWLYPAEIEFSSFSNSQFVVFRARNAEALEASAHVSWTASTWRERANPEVTKKRVPKAAAQRLLPALVLAVAYLGVTLDVNCSIRYEGKRLEGVMPTPREQP